MSCEAAKRGNCTRPAASIRRSPGTGATGRWETPANAEDAQDANYPAQLLIGNTSARLTPRSRMWAQKPAESGQPPPAGGPDTADRNAELVRYLGVGGWRVGHEQLEQHRIPTREHELRPGASLRSACQARCSPPAPAAPHEPYHGVASDPVHSAEQTAVIRLGELAAGE
jgi:hypothetical protein